MSPILNNGSPSKKFELYYFRKNGKLDREQTKWYLTRRKVKMLYVAKKSQMRCVDWRWFWGRLYYNYTAICCKNILAIWYWGTKGQLCSSWFNRSIVSNTKVNNSSFYSVLLIPDLEYYVHSVCHGWRKVKSHLKGLKSELWGQFGERAKTKSHGGGWKNRVLSLKKRWGHVLCYVLRCKAYLKNKKNDYLCH